MSQQFTDAWVEGPTSTRFYSRTYDTATPAKAHIVFVHGFAEHVGRYEQTFPVYASNGISVFAYDQRGFGRTACDIANKSPKSSWGVTSWKQQQEVIAFFILRERERLGPQLPIVLMGHSMVRNGWGQFGQ
jgi:acylglycerol lipase